MSTEIIFLRHGRDDDKERALRASVQSVCAGTASENAFLVSAESLSDVPGSPFAYWVSDRVRSLFQRLPAFEAEGRAVCGGASTKDDFRFARGWWEVPHGTSGSSREATTEGARWVAYTKGGGNAPYYNDISLVVEWEDDGSILKQFISDYRGERGWGYHWSAGLNAQEDYFLPGMSWAVRTRRFAPHPVPAGCIFSASRYQAFAELQDLMWMIGLLNGPPATLLLRMCSENVERPKFIEGTVAGLPMAEPESEDKEELAALARECWEILQNEDSADEVSRIFRLPGPVQMAKTSLADAVEAWLTKLEDDRRTLMHNQRRIDEISCRVYGIGDSDLSAAEAGFTSWQLGQEDEQSDEDEDDRVVIHTQSGTEAIEHVLSYAVGAAFGRWDVRFATGHFNVPDLPGPFSALPPDPPGMLKPPGVGAGGRKPSDYPIRTASCGMLVDDPGHDDDVVDRMTEVLDLLWGHEPGAGWGDAVRDAVGKSLRQWLRSAFFGDHIKRYTRSRRKAPIYWQLSTSSRGYAIWLYYPQMTKDTLYTVLNDYLTPKLRYEERNLTRLGQEAGPTPTASQRRDIEKREQLADELRAMREEISRAAPLWDPNLNDGVVINFAPLWRLVPQNKSWQKRCKETWEALVSGEYDWAHLAMHLWPERVLPKCAEDRSLALTHGVDEIFWQEDAEGDWHRRDVDQSQMDVMIEERTSPTVKAALNDLLSAPAPVG